MIIWRSGPGRFTEYVPSKRSSPFTKVGTSIASEKLAQDGKGLRIDVRGREEVLAQCDLRQHERLPEILDLVIVRAVRMTSVMLCAVMSVSVLGLNRLSRGPKKATGLMVPSSVQPGLRLGIVYQIAPAT